MQRDKDYKRRDEKGNGKITPDVDENWYCVRCRTYTSTRDIKRQMFTTKNGNKRRYYAGRCSVCNCKKSNMKSW